MYFLAIVGGGAIPRPLPDQATLVFAFSEQVLVVQPELGRNRAIAEDLPLDPVKEKNNHPSGPGFKPRRVCFPGVNFCYFRFPADCFDLYLSAIRSDEVMPCGAGFGP